MPASKRITQAEIARRVGVSQTTVSAVLSGQGTVSVGDDTRTRILELAGQLGYAVRKAAAKPRANPGKQNVVIVESLPLSPPNELWLEDAYQTLMGRLLASCSQHLHRQGIGSSLYYLDDPKNLMRWLADSSFSGVLWHAEERDSALLHWIASRFPLVLLNRQWNGTASFDAVSIDQEKNITVAAEYLWRMGHRRICLFGHAPSRSIDRRRLAAYRAFVEQNGLRNYQEFQRIPDAVEIATLPKVQAILEVWKGLGKEAPTALITSDVFALLLLREARSSGVRIPDDLSVVGIDNTSPGMLMEPPLTSMEEPFEQLCQVAVDLLIRRKTNRDAPSQTVQIAPRLVLRESVKSLAGVDAAVAPVSV